MIPLSVPACEPAGESLPVGAPGGQTDQSAVFFSHLHTDISLAWLKRSVLLPPLLSQAVCPPSV